MDIHQLLLYRDMEQNKLLASISNLILNIEDNKLEHKEIIKQAYADVHLLIEMSSKYGFRGNVWHNFLTYILVNHENVFSIACEVRQDSPCGLDKIALHDFRIFLDLYRYDMLTIDESLKINCFSYLQDFQADEENSNILESKLSKAINQLSKNLANAQDVNEFYHLVRTFYKDYGVGKLGLYKAFRITEKSGEIALSPITNTQNIQLKDLIGYELQKKKLIDNTQAFIQGKKANNVLLFGDSGTGKSSAIKAILNEYYPLGLRMIEVYKHQFRYLSEIIGQIKDRNYKFIIFMDDLSFEDYEIEYKYLKAIIEGGIAVKPDNVLIYATSNRRHLVREKWSDKEDRREDLHASDTVQEKLSLAARFGVSIFYGSPSKKEFEHIVCELAEKNGIQLDKDTLLLEANKWEISHGGLSGRTATQFIQYLLHCNF